MPGNIGSRRALVLALAGAALVVVSMQAATVARQPQYEYALWAGPLSDGEVTERLEAVAEDVPREDVVYRLDELSTPTREAVGRLVDGEAEETEIRGEAAAEASFDYAGDAPDYGRGKYFVTDGEAYYLIVATDAGGGAVATLAGLVVVLLAVPFTLSVLLDGDDARVTASVLAGLAAAALLSASGLGPFDGTGYVPMIGLGLAALLGTTAATRIALGLTAGDASEIERNPRTRRRALWSLAIGGLGAVSYYAFATTSVDGVGPVTFLVGLSLAFAIPGAASWHRVDERFDRYRRGAKA